MAYCQKCGDYFKRQPHETWKYLCVECWKATKKAELEELQDCVEYLEWQNRVLTERLTRVQSQPLLPNQDHGEGFLRIFPALVRIAHPDRHNGHRDAHEVLVWANAFRDDLKNGKGRACDTACQDETNCECRVTENGRRCQYLQAGFPRPARCGPALLEV
jgi:hypothetical protein